MHRENMQTPCRKIPGKPGREPGTFLLQGPGFMFRFLANGRVISVSSPVMEEEAPPTHSTERKAATHRHTQKKKKKKKVPRVPAEAPPPEPVSSVSLGQRLPFPAFPLKSSLLPLAPSGPVQAAAPPAEYHSDSAESLEEIPVALAKLGSSAGGDASTSSQRAPPFPLPSPLPRTKRKASRPHRGAAELRFEMASTQPPSVFVSRASGEAAEPRDEGLSLGRRAGGRPPGAAAASWMER
ncbi:palmitoyltransferase ZDHHC1-like isoform X2 [Amphiprion ocellaris]|uniref:palmitoyltransferase ZDHHC1-like isoform X2 n=1 Tax=Amphiprion ocellaris TaxID=80972 RepID=UPI0024113956|nr:palmitoyltransferase ZDHHC1-like isoform X2 [Amphiprion ocellaris]